ncbi:MAG: PqqD family peptide modification chaperone [Alphaproteobacteria bacterium]|nr:PqqD family peptide modification chaperone [Alphaproteobacteria bacterium]
MLLKFDTMCRPVQLARGLKVLPHLMRVFAGWPYREVPKVGNPGVLLNILHDEGRYVLEAPWLRGRLHYGDAADLAQGLATHVARGWFLEHPGLLWLDAAAVAFGDQIVVFVGGPRSGKSLLAASLAVSGNPVFADSILPVLPDGQQGMSLGMAPRLKLPLPEELQDPLRGLVEGQMESGSDSVGYLQPRDGSIAPFGRTARIRAFVTLDRSVSSAATLSPSSSGKLLKRLLLNSFGERMTVDELLEKVQIAVGDAPCFRMTWSDPQEAVNALRARFAIWRTPIAENEDQAKNQPKRKARRRPSGPRIPAGRQFRHRNGLTERLVDADLFLVNPGGQTIYHLNGLGAGLWRLLDGTHGLDDVVTVLKEAFPNADSNSIESDVKTLVGDLADRGLLIEKIS